MAHFKTESSTYNTNTDCYSSRVGWIQYSSGPSSFLFFYISSSIWIPHNSTRSFSYSIRVSIHHHPHLPLLVFYRPTVVIPPPRKRAFSMSSVLFMHVSLKAISARLGHGQSNWSYWHPDWRDTLWSLLLPFSAKRIYDSKPRYADTSDWLMCLISNASRLVGLQHHFASSFDNLSLRISPPTSPIHPTL